MRTLTCLLLPCCLAAQVPAAGLVLDLRTHLGTEPGERILLMPPGCLDGLALGALQPPRATRVPGTPGATVEVWDLALMEAPRREAFRLYWERLRQRLDQALSLPPPDHAALELNEFMASDPNNPQRLDLTKVESMQERFNRLPPNGSPVRPDASAFR